MKANIKDKISLYGYVLRNTVNKKKRNIDTINKDWNQNTWSKYTVEDFPFGSLLNKAVTDEIELFQLGKDLVKISRRQYLEMFEKRVLDLFTVDKHEQITELGCGIGNKLFFLWKNGYRNLRGYDISDNAINLANKINDKYKCEIKFGVTDITKTIPDLHENVVYTFTCLEQLPHYMPTVINNILSAKPKKVIHFEFTLNFSTKLSRSYIKSRDYQTNLLPLLQKDNRVKITKCEALGVANPVNPLTYIEWQPNNISN